MSMLLNPYRFGAPPSAGIQYVGGYNYNMSSAGAGDTSINLSGALSGGIASSPSPGDFCIVSYSQGGTADRTGRSIKNAAGEFTSLMTQYVNDVNDTSITIKYAFLAADNTVILGTPSSSGNGVGASFQVFRGVNASTPLDVAHVTNATIDTGQPDPSSITPVTSGAVIGVFGAASFTASVSGAFTSSAFDAFTSLALPATGRSHAIGFGRKAWISGAFNAAKFGGGTTSTSDSSIAVAFALRPA